MDERSFAELSKRVAAADTRRGMFEVVAAGLAATLGIAITGADSAEAAFGYCRVGGFPCGKDHQCCTNTCKGGVCGCAKKGKPCINRIGANCCSRKCRKGKCQ